MYAVCSNIHGFFEHEKREEKKIILKWQRRCLCTASYKFRHIFFFFFFFIHSLTLFIARIECNPTNFNNKTVQSCINNIQFDCILASEILCTKKFFLQLWFCISFSEYFSFFENVKLTKTKTLLDEYAPCQTQISLYSNIFIQIQSCYYNIYSIIKELNSILCVYFCHIQEGNVIKSLK